MFIFSGYSGIFTLFDVRNVFFEVVDLYNFKHSVYNKLLRINETVEGYLLEKHKIITFYRTQHIYYVHFTVQYDNNYWNNN